MSKLYRQFSSEISADFWKIVHIDVIDDGEQLI